MRELSGSQWAAVGYLVLMVTAVAFVLCYSTVRAVGAGRAGLLTGIGNGGLDGDRPGVGVGPGLGLGGDLG